MNTVISKPQRLALDVYAHNPFSFILVFAFGNVPDDLFVVVRSDLGQQEEPTLAPTFTALPQTNQVLVSWTNEQVEAIAQYSSLICEVGYWGVVQGVGPLRANLSSVTGVQTPSFTLKSVSGSQEMTVIIGDLINALGAKLNEAVQLQQQVNQSVTDNQALLTQMQQTATDANTAKQGAETARNAAVTAKTAAETARDGANTAKTASETARDAAAAAKNASEQAAVASGNAANAAGQFADTADTAADAAEAARAAAVTAKTAAETARDGANTAKNAAETAKTASETARDGSADAKTAAEAAQAAAVAAKNASEAAKAASEAARDLSVAAKNQSQTLYDNITTQGVFVGNWNATTNTPVLTTTPLAVNRYYDVTVGGTQSVTGSSEIFSVGDRIKSDGTKWVRVPNGAAPGDGTVSPKKTTFFGVGKNIFDKNQSLLANSRINTANGAIETNVSFTSLVTDFIPVSGSTTYTHETGLNRNYVEYDANQVFIRFGTTWNSTAPVTTQSTTRYIRFQITAASELNTLQVEAASTPTAYEAYRLVLKTANTPIVVEGITATLLASIISSVFASVPMSVISQGNTTFISTGKNLFNRNDTGNTTGFYVGQGTGNLAANAIYTASHFIPVVAGVTYVATESMQYAFYNASKVYISGGNDSVMLAPANAAYLRVSPRNAVINTYQVEVGSTSTGYEDFYYTTAVRANPNTGSVGVNQLAIVSFGKNLFNRNDTGNITGRYILSGNGTVQVNSDYTASHYIPVVAGVTYKATEGMQYAFYNASKVFISGGNNAVMLAPANAAYLRVSPRNAVINSYQVEVGSTSTTYESFYYKLVAPDGSLIGASYVAADALNTALDTYQEPLSVAVAPKLYIPSGKEIVVYSECVHKNFYPYRDRTEVAITGGKTTGRSGKITPATTGTISANIRVGNKVFDVLLTKTFSVQVTNATLTTPLKVLNIGDSYTDISAFANAIIAGAGTNLTFLGIRKTGATGNVLGEGRGGWYLYGVNAYVYSTTGQANTTLYCPFHQPTGTGYYLGNTSYWIKAVSAPDYDTQNIAASILAQFNGSTGYPVTPRTNDIVYDNSATAFKQWDGSAWQTIAAPTFAFSFAKYRACWGIAQPDAVHLLFGKNDFQGATESTFQGIYSNFKSAMDAVIASIKADSPSCKIVLGIPPSSGRQGEFGTYTSERQKRAFWLQANAMITDYGGREAESIYLLDYHSTTDRAYAYGNASELPYTGYTGAFREDYKADIVHPGDWTQMSNLYYGIMQSFR